MHKYNNLPMAQRDHADLNPLEMEDTVEQTAKGWNVGSFADGRPIPRMYKGGCLPRSLRTKIGHLDIVRALEVSSNPYFSLLAGDVLEQPQELVECARLFSYGSKTGIDIGGELAGNVPSDLEGDRTALYSFAIGQHQLIATPLQSAVMLSAIVNGGKVVKPHVIKMTVGDQLESQVAKKVQVTSPEMMRQIPLPQSVRNLLMKGMHQSALSCQVAGGGTLSNVYKEYPEAIRDLLNLKNQLIGKSSTSESMETVSLDRQAGTEMYNHIWFGGCAFNSDRVERSVINDQYGNPELVIIVYLRYGGYGKEAAPIAAQMVQKWREIKRVNGEKG
jgi:cell division protein FtsI/penicillin-binding protein 2